MSVVKFMTRLLYMLYILNHKKKIIINKKNWFFLSIIFVNQVNRQKKKYNIIYIMSGELPDGSGVRRGRVLGF